MMMLEKLQSFQKNVVCLSLIGVIFLWGFLAAEEFSPDFTVMIPMRDGTELPTDIYLPNPEGEKAPCILFRCPSGRRQAPEEDLSLAQEGYVIAIQDTRNVLDKEGKTFPYMSDGWGQQQDGYDTVEWLARCSFTNGQVGTMGSSALGITQLLMAPSAPPSLRCQYIRVAAPSLYHHAMFLGGQLQKNQVEGWLGRYAKDPSIFHYVRNQLVYNDFWKQLDSVKVAERVQVPAIHVGGWYDIFLQGTIDAFTARQERGGVGAQGQQKLVIGPWTHFWPKNDRLGDFEIPEKGKNVPVDISEAQWFNFHLKGDKNRIADLPPVTYYVMGPFDQSSSSGNVWKHAERWPVPAVSSPFYLTSEGLLTKREEDLERRSSLEYFYDPNNPIPTLGGKNLFLESGPKDQAPIESRSDVLVFTTDPLTEDLEVTGPICAKLYFSSSRCDTDVVVRLCDVYPDGKSILISDGIRRLGMVQGGGVIGPKHGHPLEVDVDLWSTSVVFVKGHRIRLSVSSSNYPRYEKNPNVGFRQNYLGPPLVAKNSLHMGKEFRSQMVLPVVKRGEEKK